MKVNDELIPYLKEVLKDPLFNREADIKPNPHPAFEDLSAITTIKRSANDFLCYDENDYKLAANLFRKEIPGAGKRKQAIIDAFEIAAEWVASGKIVNKVTAETQDNFFAITDLSNPRGNFYGDLRKALLYRQVGDKWLDISRRYDTKKLKEMFENSKIKEIKKQVNSFLEYQHNECQVIAFRKQADELEAKAQKQRQELSSFDFAALEQLIATRGTED